MQASTSASSAVLRPHCLLLPRGRQCLVVTAAHRRKALNQVCCSKTLVAKPGSSKTVQQLCTDVVQYSEELAEDKVNGIIVFQCVKDGWEDNVFHFWERYDNKVAMTNHNTAPKMMKFLEQVRPHLERPVGMALYEYNNGMIGTMCVAEGPKGEGGLDDATGAHGVAGGASMKQTSSGLGINHLADEEEGHGQGESEIEIAFVANVTKKVQENFKAAFKNMFAFSSASSSSSSSKGKDK